jgi:CBS domain-containing protein
MAGRSSSRRIDVEFSVAWRGFGRRIDLRGAVQEVPMTTVKRILDSKGHDVWTISPDASVFQAIREMAEREVGALVVMEGDALAGIISERDYARKVILQGHSSHAIRVADIMTRDVVTAALDDTAETCMTVMTERRIRHLPVVDQSRTVGMISIGDLVRAVIADQQFVIAQLANYVTQ